MAEIKIGEMIKTKRKERDFTQEELANILGVTKAAVSKWETSESYPDITMLPQIAQLFHITMDELFGYTLVYQPLKIENQYYFGLSLDDVDKAILDHGTVKECKLCKCARFVGDSIENTWEVRVQLISTEEKFPYILQKLIKPGCVIDGYSVRLADGKIIDDNKPNKHYVCREKVWEYRNTDIKYVRQMLQEQLAMGLIDEGDM
ncbi:MAG: helix-turn-helix transcriptional regulator [Clostridia bacterium]|nr:helix-turn-helix transcriptional regulator [Clostridia bacterium]